MALLLFLGLAAALLELRFAAPGPIAQYLWAEDGSIFINQAHTLGLAALWQPYAGYLHLYPRLVALLANQ